MNTKTDLPSVDALKNEARQLRAQSSDNANPITHSQSLEAVAKKYGKRDWNTLRQRLQDDPPASWAPEGRVSGHYLSQPFTATVVTVERLEAGLVRLSLRLDQPVDVVRFDSFSNLRRRVTGTVGPRGMSPDRTSDGEPVLRIDL